MGGDDNDDLLTGGNGNDSFIGSSGKDTLTGGNGADRFGFLVPDEGIDTITDFTVSQGDTVTVNVDDAFPSFSYDLIAGAADTGKTSDGLATTNSI